MSVTGPLLRIGPVPPPICEDYWRLVTVMSAADQGKESLHLCELHQCDCARVRNPLVCARASLSPATTCRSCCRCRQTGALQCENKQNCGQRREGKCCNPRCCPQPRARLRRAAVRRRTREKWRSCNPRGLTRERQVPGETLARRRSAEKSIAAR